MIPATVLAALAAIANVTSSSSANSTAIGGIGSIQGFANTFAADAQALIALVNNVAVSIARVAFSTLIIVGILLWFSRVNRRLGRELVEGGILVAVFVEFFVPWLSTVRLP